MSSSAQWSFAEITGRWRLPLLVSFAFGVLFAGSAFVSGMILGVGAEMLPVIDKGHLAASAAFHGVIVYIFFNLTRSVLGVAVLYWSEANKSLSQSKPVVAKAVNWATLLVLVVMLVFSIASAPPWLGHLLTLSSGKYLFASVLIGFIIVGASANFGAKQGEQRLTARAGAILLVGGPYTAVTLIALCGGFFWIDYQKTLALPVMVKLVGQQPIELRSGIAANEGMIFFKVVSERSFELQGASKGGRYVETHLARTTQATFIPWSKIEMISGPESEVDFVTNLTSVK